MQLDVMSLRMYLVQSGQADLWGHQTSVPDPELAQRVMVNRALEFADPWGKELAGRVADWHPHLVEGEKPHQKPLSANAEVLEATAHVTAYAPLEEDLSKKRLFVIDTGHGVRMRLAGRQPKGSVEVAPERPLYYLAAGAAAWCLEALPGWVAVTSADQVVVLSEADRNAVPTCLEVASERADIVCFDVPPPLSVTRLAPLMGKGAPSQHNSAAAGSRKLTLLTEYGGAGFFQAVFFRRHLLPEFEVVLRLLHSAALEGHRPNLAPYDLLVWPHFFGAEWMMNAADRLTRQAGEKLLAFHQKVAGIWPIHRPIAEVFNCNTTWCLDGLRARYFPAGI